MGIGYKAVARSDTGRLRPNNEDRVASFSTPAGALWMVCDGMGGHNAGEKAAELAIQAVADFFGKAPPLPPTELLEKALYEANHAIYTMAQLHPEYRKMGTTSVVALYTNEKVYYAHIGDSRLYHYRKGKLFQKTLDHSYVQFLLSQGMITPEEAAYHPRRNIILRALGLSPRPEPEIAPEPISVESGDLLLLCSDGLTSMLSEAEISHILGLRLSLLQRAEALIDAANDAGGQDNISLILVEFFNTP